MLNKKTVMQDETILKGKPPIIADKILSEARLMIKDSESLLKLKRRRNVPLSLRSVPETTAPPLKRKRNTEQIANSNYIDKYLSETSVKVIKDAKDTYDPFKFKQVPFPNSLKSGTSEQCFNKKYLKTLNANQEMNESAYMKKNISEKGKTQNGRKRDLKSTRKDIYVLC